jgi:hypothetical protein
MTMQATAIPDQSNAYAGPICGVPTCERAECQPVNLPPVKSDDLWTMRERVDLTTSVVELRDSLVTEHRSNAEHVIARRDLAESVVRLQSTIAEYRDGLETLGEYVKQAAIDNDLCGVYDRTMAELPSFRGSDMFANAALRESEYSVTVSLTSSVSFTVTASDSDAAGEMADDWQNYADWSEVRDNATVSDVDVE